MKVIITGTTGYVGEGAEAMIAVTKGGYRKPAIECRDITKLAKR
jgi:hypothetical protein